MVLLKFLGRLLAHAVMGLCCSSVAAVATVATKTLLHLLVWSSVVMRVPGAGRVEQRSSNCGSCVCNRAVDGPILSPRLTIILTYLSFYYFFEDWESRLLVLCHIII
jgi:hypothetical protein